MRSVADDLRDATRRADLRLTPAQRVERALVLGDEDLAAYAAAQMLGSDRARRILAHRRRAGRRTSACIERLRS